MMPIDSLNIAKTFRKLCNTWTFAAFMSDPYHILCYLKEKEERGKEQTRQRETRHAAARRHALALNSGGVIEILSLCDRSDV